MVQFCHFAINTGKENWHALLQEEVLNAKINKNTESHEKMICQDSDSEEDDCVDHELAQPKILSLSEAIPRGRGYFLHLCTGLFVWRVKFKPKNMDSPRILYPKIWDPAYLPKIWVTNLF